MPRRLEVLALFDAGHPLAPGEDLREILKSDDWKTEAGVLKALRRLGHRHGHLVVFDDLAPLRRRLAEPRPDVVLNLADMLGNDTARDHEIASCLARSGVPFTGCGPAALRLCKDKAAAKRLLTAAGVRTPAFAVLRRGGRAAAPRRLRFPLVVKPLRQEASYGIALASFVRTAAELAARARFIHSRMKDDALAEEYVGGRELYASLLGGRSPQVLPLRELVFGQVPPGAPRLATWRAKWNESYRERRGLRNRSATGLPPAVVRKIGSVCRRIHRLLKIDGCVRLDLRLTAQNEVWFIEANPNPIMAKDEDFAQSAGKAGISYPRLIDRILRLGLKTKRD